MPDLHLGVVVRAFHEKCPHGYAPLTVIEETDTLIEKDDIPETFRDTDYSAREYVMGCASCQEEFRLILGLFPKQADDTEPRGPVSVVNIKPQRLGRLERLGQRWREWQSQTMKQAPWTALFIGLCGIPITTLLDGYTFTFIWNVLVAASFKLPTMSLVHGVALSLFGSVFGFHDRSVEDNTAAQSLTLGQLSRKLVLNSVGVNGVVIGLAWLLSLFS